MDKRFVLVVEDSEIFLECIRETFALARTKYQLDDLEYKAFDNCAEAEKFLEANRNIALLLTDVQLEDDTSGLEFATHFCNVVPGAPVYIMTRTLPKKPYPIMNQSNVKHAKKPLSADAIEKIFKETFYDEEM